MKKTKHNLLSWDGVRDIIKKENEKNEDYGIELSIQPAYQTTDPQNIVTIVTSPLGTEIEGPLRKIMELVAKKHGVGIKNIPVEKPGEISIAGQRYVTSCNKIVFYAEVLYYDKEDKLKKQSVEEAAKNLLNATEELFKGLSKNFNF